jgi:hypothetical protein
MVTDACTDEETSMLDIASKISVLEDGFCRTIAECEETISTLERMSQTLQERHTSLEAKLGHLKEAQNADSTNSLANQLDAYSARVIRELASLTLQAQELKAEVSVRYKGKEKAKMSLKTAISLRLSRSKRNEQQSNVAQERKKHRGSVLQLDKSKKRVEELEQEILVLGVLCNEFRRDFKSRDYGVVAVTISSEACIRCFGVTKQAEFVEKTRSMQTLQLEWMQANSKLKDVADAEKELRIRIAELVLPFW